MLGGVGARIYLVRLALGDGMRTPMPMRQFAALLAKDSGRPYDASMISLMETGKRRATLEDIVTIAGKDPQRRGRSWLAFADGETSTEVTDEVLTILGGSIPTSSFRDLSDSEYRESLIAEVVAYLNLIQAVANLVGGSRAIQNVAERRVEMVNELLALNDHPHLIAYREAITAYVTNEINEVKHGTNDQFFVRPAPRAAEMVPDEKFKIESLYRHGPTLSIISYAARILDEEVSPNLGRRAFYEMTIDEFREESERWMTGLFLVLLVWHGVRKGADTSARISKFANEVSREVDKLPGKLEIAEYAAHFASWFNFHRDMARHKMAESAPSEPPRANRKPGPGSDESLRLPPMPRAQPSEHVKELNAAIEKMRLTEELPPKSSPRQRAKAKKSRKKTAAKKATRNDKKS